MSARAEQLCRRLKQKMQILLVLDDVWEKLELYQLGITFGNDRNQCKMLLTSRFHDVMENDMSADMIFLLRELSDNEAKGLPIAIETVANALKNKTSSIWKNAMQELRMPSPVNIKGTYDKLFKPIKLSYKYMESDEAKLMLLYIDGVQPHTVKMHDVIHDVVTSIGSQERRMFNLRNYVPKLEDSGKLKDATAVSLLYSSDESQLPERLECLYGCDLGDVALIGELKSLKNLHIEDSNIVELPKQIGQLTRLQLLNLSNCPKLEVIEHNFILSLIHLEESHLQDSFTKWDMDRGLDELDIRRLREDHHLKMLLEASEVLNLRKSKGVKNLVYDLDLEGLPQLKNLVIVENDEMVYIINSMEQNHPCCAFLSLELLYLEKLMKLEKMCYGKLSTDSFGKLRVVKVRDCDRLKNLFSFSIAQQLEEIEVIECKMLREIVYLRDYDPSIIPTKANAQFLVLSKLDSEMLWPDQLPETFNVQNLKTLTVNGCLCLKHMSSFATAGSVVHLKHLEVCHCTVMEEVIAINDIRDLQRMDKKLLPNLKFLSLKDLPDIVELPRELGHLTCSRLLTLRNCPKLEMIEPDTISSLISLEELYMANCFTQWETEKSNACLSELKNLTRLSTLRLAIPDANGLPKDLFHTKLGRYNINIGEHELMPEKFQISRKLDLKLETSSLLEEHSGLQMLMKGSEELGLNGLEGLTNVVYDLDWEARILLKLEEVRVAECSMMEEIVIREIEDDHNQNISNKAANNQIEFPEPYSLKLKSLPKFIQVFTEMKTNSTCWSAEEEVVKFPKVETLTLMGISTLSAIWNCQYEGQVGDDQEHAGILFSLEGLKLSELPRLKHLWEDDYHHGRAFNNLKILIVNGCDRLKKLVPSPISFKNLRFLRVSKCHGMENLLKSSTAKSLTQMQSFCNGQISTPNLKRLILSALTANKKDEDGDGRPKRR
ncbi:probable disease resistance protein At4g27220 [Ziziphus jujuba]|uniref:Probable disease resistance protein At4g27220 n=1 Tax=Ziziphus jujuba TaxID=326968 RepID=A0ABM3ZTW3_ZIZJJ|nr:probable disease resistance protein At4g27220 [Ziziphus jujuba]